MEIFSQRKTLKHKVATSLHEVVLPRSFVNLVEPWTAMGVLVFDIRTWFSAALCPQGTSPAPTGGSPPPRSDDFGSIALPLQPPRFLEVWGFKAYSGKNSSEPLYHFLPRSYCRLSLKKLDSKLHLILYVF